jgi:hypothetical protein
MAAVNNGIDSTLTTKINRIIIRRNIIVFFIVHILRQVVLTTYFATLAAGNCQSHNTGPGCLKVGHP